MAIEHTSALRTPASNRLPHQQALFSLISVLCAPRQSQSRADVCRLIVDSRLPWAVEPTDANTSWLYLPFAARARQVAGCLVLTFD